MQDIKEDEFHLFPLRDHYLPDPVLVPPAAQIPNSRQPATFSAPTLQKDSPLVQLIPYLLFQALLGVHRVVSTLCSPLIHPHS